jgi:hypothetical protein
MKSAGLPFAATVHCVFSLPFFGPQIIRQRDSRQLRAAIRMPEQCLQNDDFLTARRELIVGGCC